MKDNKLIERLIDWDTECLCGNEIEPENFVTCTEDGTPNEKGEFNRCKQCGRIIHNITLEVVGIFEDK